MCARVCEQPASSVCVCVCAKRRGGAALSFANRRRDKKTLHLRLRWRRRSRRCFTFGFSLSFAFLLDSSTLRSGCYRLLYSKPASKSASQRPAASAVYFSVSSLEYNRYYHSHTHTYSCMYIIGEESRSAKMLSKSNLRTNNNSIINITQIATATTTNIAIQQQQHAL